MPEQARTHEIPRTKRRCTACIVLPIVLLFLVAGSCVLQDCLTGNAEQYANDEHQFKYGSIGSDNLHRGIPYRIFKVLPVIFDDLFIGLAPATDKKGFQRLGMIEEIELPAPIGSNAVEFPRPIGFSKRNILGLNVVGLNCAFCHVSTLRPTPESEPSKPILRMPANRLYAEAFFRFLARVGKDPRFTSENLLAEMTKQDPKIRWYEKLVYQQVIIPVAKVGITNLGKHLEFLEEKGRPEFGPGRVETWAIYKILRLQHSIALVDLLPELWASGPDLDPRPGTGFADFPAIWRTKPELGPYHWDGNNPSLTERNTIAGMGAGITPPSRDEGGLRRVTDWIETPLDYQYKDYAPVPNQVKSDLSARGQAIYLKLCASCHDEPKDGKPAMRIVPLAEIGTDRARLDSFTQQLTAKLNTVGRGYSWHLHQFTKTNGYANMTLKGIWLRAPYLHNGSVPTLRDLLKAKAERPSMFYRGDDVYDWVNVGFRSTQERDGEHYFFPYDTTREGNGNGGHEGRDYGTQLEPQEKDDLIEYLKTL